MNPLNLKISIAFILSLALLSPVVKSAADGTGDNSFEKVRRVPSPGVAVPASDRAELESGIESMRSEIELIKTLHKNRPALLDLLPDVQIYYNAARYTLTYDEFFSPNEISAAKTILREGLDRADSLRDGKTPWTTQTGLVARGYISRIDGSIQPYGLVVPASYHHDAPHHHRLDIWFHGRGENLSELNFIRDRERNPGEFTPADTFVLHPYGRYCNANRFAGEIDTLEALAHAKKHYPIDPDRISVRGFSMGGAACWQFAVHYAGDWASAAPGAGFSETADFLKVFQKENLQPTWYEKKLWHMYDSTDYAENLWNCPTVVYSGEKDSQKEAADMMNIALQKEGISMVHIIGLGAGHFYTPAGREEVSRRIDSIAAKGRNPLPSELHLTTWTLRYNKMLWLTLDGLQTHWERARVHAQIKDSHTVQISTKNVTAFTLDMQPGMCPLDVIGHPSVIVDGSRLQAPAVWSDRSWLAHFRKVDGHWAVVETIDDGSLRKRPGLQGPIDDAFLDSFVMVKPTGTPVNSEVAAWCSSEQAHAISQWRQQFRGEAPVKLDTEVTDEDIAHSNLILWGDPSSNKILARIAAKLPILWNSSWVQAGTKALSADHHVPVMIFPNPLNPKHYVVLNSGFTYREYDYLNNARQTSKLPDFAIIDVREKPNYRTPGKIVDAGFFDDQWKLMTSVK